MIRIEQFWRKNDKVSRGFDQNKGLIEGTILNQAMPSLLRRSLKITLTVPFSVQLYIFPLGLVWRCMLYIFNLKEEQ